MELIEGDIHDIIKTLPSNKYDLLYTNPPFNSLTRAKWDNVLNWEELWEDIWRVLKPNGVVVLHATQRFTIELASTQIKYFKYKYVWKKSNSTNFLCSKYQPLRICEDICVFYKKAGIYNPQMIGDKFQKKRNVKYGGANEYWGECKTESNIITDDGGHIGKFPNDLLEFKIDKSERHEKNAGTRSIELIDFILKTYSNENSEVLDITCYDARTGIRCMKLNRHYTGIDLNIKI
tara:strand:- start:1059 stop:1760 length:702 start_codon:yes stop_codon:yes gene_type:complete